jgi:drug/metabolite transporter (DMT)-like permease
LIALWGGLGAGLSWAVATIGATRASRAVGPAVTTAFVMALGLVLVVPLALIDGVPSNLSGLIGWAVLGGALNLLGIGVIYTALRSGLVGIVAAVVATEGAMAALISAAAGEPLSGGLIAALAMVTIGVVITAGAGNSQAASPTASRRTTIALAFLAAMLFAVSLYATGRASGLPAAWVVLPPRVLGTIFVALPLALRGKLRIPVKTVRLLMIPAVCEVLGFLSFTAGSRDSIAVASVCAAPGAVFSAIGAFLVFRERLGRLQMVGILVTVVGVGAVGALSA